MHFSVVHWSIDEGRAWLERALGNSEEAPLSVRIKALSGAGWLAFHQSDMEQAEMLFEKCLQLYQEAKEVRKAPGMILPDRTYILPEETLASLSAAGIKFKEISRESETPLQKGALAGERI